MQALNPSRFIVATFMICSASPLLAQGNGNGPGNGPRDIDVTPVCMTGSLPEVAQVRREDRGKPIQIMVIQNDTGDLARRGFQPRPCAQTDLAEDSQRQSYRDDVCELSSRGNQAVQNQLESALGVRPAVLCASAEIISGPWERRGNQPETKAEGAE